MISEEYWSSSAAIVGSPGGLVWVRRRNGSWWPGRIVPTDELAAKYASRSGTPIQLLGREDGSMDWYNLEKSKRVKPFRCGEYDECIEKVKDSEPRSSKSASNKGKYVRRDDAILHALKLEKALCFSGEQICSGTHNSLVTTGSTQFKKHKLQSLETQPGYRPNKHSVFEDNSTQELSRSVVQFKQPSKLIARSMRIMQKRKWRTPNDLEDDEGIKRMRDLQEIGTGRPSHRKRKMCVHSRWSHDPVVADRVHTESTHAIGFNRTKSSSNPCSSMRKQSHVQVHEFVKRKDRRRALNKVGNGTRVIIPSYCHWDGSFSGRPSLQGTVETNPESTSEDTTESSKYSGTSSDETLFNVDGNAYEVNNSDFVSKVNGLSNMLEFIGDDCTRSTNGLVNIPLSMDENVDGDCPNTMEHHVSGKLQPQAAAIKKYHGRSRDGSISRYVEGLDESAFKCLGSRVHYVRQKTQMKALEQYSIAKKIHKHLKNAKKQVENIGLDILYDVEVSVRRNTHGSHAPLVSLMSKLNGKAIIGHPVPVEIMEDGATDALFVRNGNQPAKNNTSQFSINGGEMIRRKENVIHRHMNTEGPNYNHVDVTTSNRKSSNNWKSGFSPRKIRRLSSFSADHKQEKKVVAEKMDESIIACIPVRLVFSRITKALS